MNTISYRHAVRDALAEEMERDRRVFLLGEDLTLGGVFATTPGLAERFGPERVIDTPISELAFTGAAFGAAISGSRPVVEIMFGDFLALPLDTLVNQASKYWYLSNGQSPVPLVVRSAVGAGGRFGACHSQTPTSWFLSEPGLKLVAPATPGDAKGLLKAAIRDDNPVIVFEHKALYGHKGAVGEGNESLVPIGKAAIRREGTDITLIAALAAVGTSLEAATHLAGEGISADVIDLRTLRPLDIDAVVSSATKTGKVVVTEEGPPMGGYAAEVLAVIAEHVGSIRATRVSMPDLPVPFSPLLEDAALPGAEKIVHAAHRLTRGEAH